MATTPDDGTTDSLRVDGSLRIPLRELTWRFDPSGGPGGQHANKVSTRAEVRWDVEASPSLSDWQRTRLVEKVGGEIRVAVDQSRSQSRNRTLALEKLAEQVAEALRREAPRRATKPTKASQRRRLDAKKQRSQTKQGRGRIRPVD